MWPFKKKIKVNLTVVDTQAEVNRKEAERTNWEKLNNLRESNKQVIKDLSAKIISELVKEFQSTTPQPFEYGDKVIIATSSYLSGLGWLSSGISFIHTFKSQDPRIGHSTIFKVDKIWVDTGWLQDKLDISWGPVAVDWLDIESPVVIETRMREYIKKLSNERPQGIIEWAVDFNWKELAFNASPGSGKEYLDLKWGGFPAFNFIKLHTPAAAAQIELELVKKEYLAVKEKYEVEEKKYQEQIKQLKLK